MDILFLFYVNLGFNLSQIIAREQKEKENEEAERRHREELASKKYVYLQ